MAHQIISDSRASGFYLSKRGSGALPGLRSIRLSFQDGEGRIRRESDRRFDVQRSVDAPHHIPLRPRFLGRDSFRGTVGGGKTNDGSSDPSFVIPRPCIARWRKVRDSKGEALAGLPLKHETPITPQPPACENPDGPDARDDDGNLPEDVFRRCPKFISKDLRKTTKTTDFRIRRFIIPRIVLRAGGK